LVYFSKKTKRNPTRFIVQTKPISLSQSPQSPTDESSNNEGFQVFFAPTLLSHQKLMFPHQVYPHTLLGDESTIESNPNTTKQNLMIGLNLYGARLALCLSSCLGENARAMLAVLFPS
jgi:hypothetical protein